MWRWLVRAAQSLLVFVSVVTVASFLGERRVYGAPQTTGTKSAVDTAPPPTAMLRLKETAVLSPAAPNAFGAGTKCDSDGDVFLQLAYFDPTRGRVDADPSISEVIPESKRVVTYGQSLPSSDYPNSNLRSFNVTPSGEVYALISTRQDRPKEGPRPRPEYYVERFKDDGTTDSITHVETPPSAARWLPDLLAASRDGSLLVAGTVSRSTDPEHPNASSWRPLTAIYDRSGRFVREITLPDDIVNDSADGNGLRQQDAKPKATIPPTANAAGSSGGADKAPAAETQASSGRPSKSAEFFDVSITTGGLVSGLDGNVWILRASDPLRLYAVSSAGEVVKHFQFSAPGPGMKPFAFGFVGLDQIFFKFAHFANGPGAASGSPDLLGVFNTVSERFETFYTLPDTEKGFRVLACSDGHGGFLYLGGTPDNHLAVYDYIP